MQEGTASPVELFIASIGIRDPETESGPTGPLRGALELRPRRVVLIALPGVGERAEATRERIAAELPEADVAVEHLGVSDQVDMDELLARCGRLLDPLTNGLDPHQKVAVCASSGTPQLMLALTLATMAHAPQALHFQAADPAKTDRPWRTFDPDALRHHAELDAAFTMLAACRFAEAAALLERRMQSSTTTARASLPSIRAALALARAVGYADALRPADAAPALRAASVKGLPSGAVGDWQAITTWYDGFRKAGMQRNSCWPVELAALSLRQQTAGLEAPALLTAAIAFEVALAVRLRTAHQLDPDRLKQPDLDQLPGPLRDKARQFANDPKMYRIEGARLRSQALAHVDADYNDVLRRFADGEKELIERRNDVMHQAKRPASGAVDEAAAFLAATFTAFGWPDPSSCPSAPRFIAKLVRSLRLAAGVP